MTSPSLQPLPAEPSRSKDLYGYRGRSESIRSRWNGREVPPKPEPMVMPGLRPSAGMAVLPPHLKPNPIAEAFSPPSLFTRFCAATFSWSLLAGALGWGIVLNQRASLKSREEYLPQTVSLVFNQGLEAEGAPSSSGPSSAPGRSMDPESSESSEPAEAAFDPRDQTDLDPVEMPVPLPLEQLVETDLLPTRAVVLAGAKVSGKPGGTGSGSGNGGGGSGQGTPGATVRWGMDMFLSGTGRGLEVGVDTLEVIRQEIPKYPSAANWEGVDGDVVVDVVIDEKGIPIGAEVVRSDHPLLVPSVLGVVPRWRFTPVIYGGRKVRANFRICFRFILNGK